MIPVPPGLRVLIATRPVDFRKGADSLAALAKETLAQDPFSGAVLVFRSRRADRIKILVWGARAADRTAAGDSLSPRQSESGRPKKRARQAGI